MSTKRERIFSWDYIRVLAMLCIILYHWNQYAGLVNISTPMVLVQNFPGGDLSSVALPLFFILSGASLMLTTQQMPKLTTYYKKRWLSIYPLYYVVYIMAFVWYYVIGKNQIYAPYKSLILTALGMDGYLFYKIPAIYLVGEWFVGCIVLLYIIYPFLRWAMQKAPVITAIGAAGMYILLYRFYPFEMYMPRFFLMRVPELLFGMYFCQYVYPFGIGADAFRGKKSMWPWLIGSGLASVLLLSHHLPVQESLQEMLMGFALFLFLACLFGLVSAYARKLNRIIGWFAGKSYAIFLLHHFLIGNFLARYAEGHLSRMHNYFLLVVYFVIITLLSIVATWISKWLVKAFRRLFHKKAGTGN